MKRKRPYCEFFVPRKRAKIHVGYDRPLWWSDRTSILSHLLGLDFTDPVLTDTSWAVGSVRPHIFEDLQFGDIDQANMIATEPPSKPRRKGKKKGKKSINKLSKKGIQDDECIRAFRVAIKPNHDQRAFLNQCFGTSRFFYNTALHSVKNREFRPEWMKIKKHYLSQDQSPLLHTNPYMLSDAIPRDLKDSAIREYCSAHLKAIESVLEKGGSPKRIQMEPKKKKDTSQSFQIDPNGGRPPVQLTNTGFKFWSTKIDGEIKPVDKRQFRKLKTLLETQAMRTVTVKRFYPSRYYLIFPIVKTVKPIADRTRVVALDPGVRTFQTTYDSRRTSNEYGVGAVNRIIKLAKRQDKLQSRVDQLKLPHYETKQEKLKMKNKRRKLHIQSGRLERRIQGLRDDLHHKIALDLCRKYEEIMIPTFNVSEMVKKNKDEKGKDEKNKNKSKKREIPKKTVRQMLRLGHYEFRQRLKAKAFEYGTKIHEVSEHYTSKTCTNCGNKKHDLKGAKVYRCRRVECGMNIDRDLNGARNIFLMNVECRVGQIEL